jgi:hypothetical protein
LAVLPHFHEAGRKKIGFELSVGQIFAKLFVGMSLSDIQIIRVMGMHMKATSE